MKGTLVRKGKRISQDERYEELIKNVLIKAKEELKELDEDDFPYDFNSNAIHDIIFSEVDAFVSGFDREECLAWIDYCNNEEYIDKGVVDNSNIDRILVTTAFECIRTKLFDDDLIYDLQEYELTDEKRNEFIRRIDERIDNANYNVGEDNETQIFIEFDFDLTKEDFEKPYFADGQVTELGGDTIKIFTCNHSVNRNAIVIERVHGNTRRVYLMEKDEDVDIRDFFKYTPTIKETGYNLSPALYTDGILKKKFENKKELLYILNRMANKLLEKTDAEMVA